MKYIKGDDFQEHGKLKTFGITEVNKTLNSNHNNKIEVYDDEPLRDKILDFLKQIKGHEKTLK